MSPVFSIIIPVYNVAPYLRECLDSVQAQTFNDWEAICIDDGSTDGSGAILDEYGACNSRFRIIHQSNAGVSVARNLGLDRAKGKWIWFVDGDDMIHPDALNHVWGIVGQNDSLEAYAFRKRMHSSVKLYDWPPFEANSSRIFSEHREVQYSYFHLGACNVLFKNSSRLDIRFDNSIKIGEDILFFSFLFWNLKKFVLDDSVIYFYRRRSGSASEDPASVKAVRDNIFVEYVALENIKKNKSMWDHDDFADYFSKRCKYLITMHKDKFLMLSNSDRKKVMRDWLKLQHLVIELGGGIRYLKSAVAVLSVFQSAYLARLLVVFIIRARNRTISTIAKNIFAHIICINDKHKFE